MCVCVCVKRPYNCFTLKNIYTVVVSVTVMIMFPLIMVLGGEDVAQTTGGQEWRGAELGCQMVCFGIYFCHLFVYYY